MKYASPLRYPGGKALMTSLLSSIRSINGLGDRAIVEPYAGGAGAALSLLFCEDTHEITINDADTAIHDFWWSVINQPKPFINYLRSVEVSIEEWYRQRDIYRSKRRTSRLRRGFAAFYLNRCNRSGIIINGGPIGGMHQEGSWKLDARFNRQELEARCLRVAEYGSRIQVTCKDGIDFIAESRWDRTFYFIDPPYYVKGETLYLNKLDHGYHQKLANRLKTMLDEAWVLTYDDCPQIRELYQGWACIRPFSLRYTASERRKGREVFITPPWIQLPDQQISAAIEW